MVLCVYRIRIPGPPTEPLLPKDGAKCPKKGLQLVLVFLQSNSDELRTALHFELLK